MPGTTAKRRKIYDLIDNPGDSFLCSVLEHLVQSADDLVRTEGHISAGTEGSLAATVAYWLLSVENRETRGYTLLRSRR